MKENSLEKALENANYAATDSYFRDILNNNPSLNPGNLKREIMFRVGRSLDGGSEPPENIDIYVSLVGELMKRYAKNYLTTGLPRKILYWAIWNEPDLPIFWNSNPQAYYEFFAKIARLAKTIDPEIKVGGPSVATGYNPGGAYTDGFLKYCRDNNVPLGFYSWHLYGNNTADPYSIIEAGYQVSKSLKTYDLENIESICTEWNISPFPTKNVHSKSQSAKNAAFISSYFIGMQYTKVDKAYYYRGDAASFGLTNDQNNLEAPGYKNFCTCAGQSFNLFSRMFETPYILTSERDFSSGITALAGKNQSENKINILVANYKVDANFANANLPPSESSLYQQHYVDTNRTIEQLNDSWSKDHWFGGIDPNQLYPQNELKQNPSVPFQPIYGQLKPKQKNYLESDQGARLQIENMKYNTAKVTAYRIQEGKGLHQMTPPEVSHQVQVSFSNNTLTLFNEGAKPSTVTFYTLELTNEDKPSPPPPQFPSENIASKMYYYPSQSGNKLVYYGPVTAGITPAIRKEYLTPGHTYHVSYKVIPSATDYRYEVANWFNNSNYFNAETQKVTANNLGAENGGVLYKNVSIKTVTDGYIVSGDVYHGTANASGGASLPYYWKLIPRDSLVIQDYTITDITSKKLN